MLALREIESYQAILLPLGRVYKLNNPRQIGKTDEAVQQEDTVFG
jgi:hypothetical protein